MKRQLLLLALGCCWCVPAGAEEPVQFGDSILRAIVEEILWIEDPTPSDMLGFTYLDARETGVQSLQGLEYAKNLLTLHLGDNQYITDVTPLAGLANLRTLILNQNRIADISPLAGLVNLGELDIHHNEIRDVSALSGMTKLWRLAVRENPIRDITPLAGLVDVRTLVLSCTEVSDLSPLLSMRSLEHLDLRECPLDASAYNTYIPQIRANNPGVEIRYDPLKEFTVEIAASAGGTVTYPGEGTFAFETGRIILLVARPNPGCVFRNWSGTFTGAENPTSLTIAANHSIQANFLDLSHTLFVDDTGPNDPAPGDNTRSDSREDGTADHPFDAIQEAIDAAVDGMSVFVRPGVYRENIDFLGKSIRLVGTNPDQPDPQAFPRIEGAAFGPIVSFTHGEDAGSELAGFVLTRGVGDLASAIFCDASSPTLRNCLIVGNRATHAGGAAVYCRDSQATIANCTIADNLAGGNSAAVKQVGGRITLISSILWSNSPAEILATVNSNPWVQSCDIAGGWPGILNVDVDPLFVAAGAWADPSTLERTDDHAGAVWIDGDYHLQSKAGRRSENAADWCCDNVTSPCIDAGDLWADVGDEPAPNGAVVNQGVYGGTTQASKSTRK